MTAGDIPFVLELSTAEKWGHSAADIARLLSFAPQGCFIAWEANERLGTITSTRYGDFAFLAVLIVREQSRGHGVGRQLMEHAIARLKADGVTTIELDGVLKAVPLYRRIGFRSKHYSLRFRGQAPDLAATVELIEPAVRNEILDFDRRHIDLPRTEVIDRFLTEFAESAYVLGDKSVRGYCVLRPRLDDSLSLGPLVAGTRDDAVELLTGVLSKYRGRMIRIGVPDIRGSIAGHLKRLGFGQAEPSLRMYLGERRDYERHAYAIISAEKS